MKLVATAAFRNTAPDKIIVAGAQHPGHVHKGARFTIGGDTPLDQLTPDDRRLVVLLNTAGRIVEESQVELVAKVDAEVKAEAAAAGKRKA